MPKKPALPPGVRERDGRYTFRYSIEVVVEGKRTRKQKETESYSSAKEAYDAGILIEADKIQGRLVDVKNITLGDYCKRWLKDYEIEREPRPSTLRNREIALTIFKKHIGEHTRMKDISPDDYQQWLNWLRAKKKKKGTIIQYHSGLKMMFSDAVRKKIIAISPEDGAILPAFKQTLAEIELGVIEIPLFLEKKQLQHLLAVTRFRGRPQEYEILLILAYTGLRIGELAALKTNDFNEKDRTLSITKTLTVLSSIQNYTLGPPKNNSSIRIVTIGDSVIKAIKSQLAWRDRRIMDGEAEHDNDFIFWSYDQPGFPLSYHYLTQQFKKLLSHAELPLTLSPHSLRHTHVSLLAAAGEELVVIQQRLGHKNDSVTRRIYLHVTQEKRKAVPDRFEKVMNS